MEYRLDRFSVLKLGLFAGVAYALMSLVIFVPFFLILGAAGESLDDGGSGDLFVGGGAALIFMPILYGIMGFIGGVLTGFVYNVIAKIMGGIQFTMTGIDTPPTSQVVVPAAVPPASPFA